MSTVIDPQRLAELKVWGFTVIEDVLAPDAVAPMRELVEEQAFTIGVEHGYRGTARHLANLVALDAMFLPVIDHPMILPYIEAVMGKQLILGSLNARVVRPGEAAQTLHGDVPVAMLRPADAAPLMMNTVWALSDLTPENGGTRLVPGSHQSHLQGTAARSRAAARDAADAARRFGSDLPRADLARRRREPLGPTAQRHVRPLPQ